MKARLVVRLHIEVMILAELKAKLILIANL